jgi:phosphate transport system ATP-binding protein
MVTHNLAQARRASDHTMFFYDGQLVEHGTTQQIFESPQEGQTERYVNGHMG